MSTKENGVSTGTPNSHAEVAQARVQELRQMRELIPHFVMPESGQESQRLNSAASVPAEFVELTTVAIANEKVLVRGDSSTPEEIRDLVSYADAYDPLADELEALAQFVRHSVNAARYKVGSQALTTYEVAKRLAKRREYAGLATYVADMRRALGRMHKLTPEQQAARKAARAAKAKARQAAKTAPPAPASE